MNKKRIWFIIPTTILPYLTLLAVATTLLSTTHPVFEFIMDSVFGSNGIYLIATLLLCYMFAAGLSIICFVLSIRRGWDSLSLAKSAVIIKLIQVPAYIIIFILGVLFSITIFTLPFVMAFIFLNCLTLISTGLLTTAAVINAVRQGVFKSEEVILLMLLQIVFCADVVASIVFYLRLRKRFCLVQ